VTAKAPPKHRSVYLALTPKQAEHLRALLDHVVALDRPSHERASLATSRDHLVAAMKGKP
jgi:hypothetical protein